MRYFLLAFIILTLGGCANPYTKFYKANPTENLADLELLSSGQTPIISSSSNFDADVKRYFSKNFRLIGTSFFNGKLHAEEDIIQQAIQIRATHVIYGAKFLTTQTVSTPVFTPNGVGGIDTTVFQRQQLRYDQGAIFFAKSKKKLRFGIMSGELTPDLRKTLGSNTGAVVKVVTEDTPAFFANLFSDDLIISLDNTPIESQEQLGRMLDAIPPDREKITLGILRNTIPVEVVLELKR